MNLEMLGLPFRASVIAASILGAASLLGCSAIVNPDSDLLGPDPGVDSGTVVLMDSGDARIDAGPRDGGGVPCTEGAKRCVGETLFTCVGGAEIPRDCRAVGDYCDVDQCRDQVCEPNRRQCTPALNAVLSCSARGDLLSREACPNGCDPETITCLPPGGVCDDVPSIDVGGRHTVDLCERADNNTHQPADGCGSTSRADVQDQIFSLTLERRQRVTIELTDVDAPRAVDTLVYVRRTCDDMGSQIACDDDVPCDRSTADPPACFGGVDVRQSRITLTLDAGTYFIVVDGFAYTNDSVAFSCGLVELRVERDSPFPFP